MFFFCGSNAVPVKTSKALEKWWLEEYFSFKLVPWGYVQLQGSHRIIMGSMGSTYIYLQEKRRRKIHYIHVGKCNMPIYDLMRSGTLATQKSSSHTFSLEVWVWTFGPPKGRKSGGVNRGSTTDPHKVFGRHLGYIPVVSNKPPQLSSSKLFGRLGASQFSIVFTSHFPWSGPPKKSDLRLPSSTPSQRWVRDSGRMWWFFVGVCKNNTIFTILNYIYTYVYFFLFIYLYIIYAWNPNDGKGFQVYLLVVVSQLLVGLGGWIVR